MKVLDDIEIDAFDSEVLTSLFAAWRGEEMERGG